MAHPLLLSPDSRSTAGVILLTIVAIEYGCQVLADGAGVPGLSTFGAHTAIPAAAILVSAGFFLSSAGRERTGPNRFIVLLYAGMASLAFGAVALGVGLLAA